MSPGDPRANMRPKWFGARQYELLAALEDSILSCQEFASEEQQGVLPILRHSFAMLWFLGKTGSLDCGQGPHDNSLEMLELVEHAAAEAARKTREIIAPVAEEIYDDEVYDDELAQWDREVEREEQEPPQAHVVEGAVTVRLPGRSGDTVTFSFSVDESGHLRAEGNGPFAELDPLTRLDLRAACVIWEALTDRISCAPTK
ncbi:hypothetical protein [Streptomyces sp. NPDC058426]|uniref:hypothetical protein n=1 Tax=Streptomyces sp. NPDC058426 TaxID=3346493 RepID=UPI0036498E3A